MTRLGAYSTVPASRSTIYFSAQTPISRMNRYAMFWVINLDDASPILVATTK